MADVDDYSMTPVTFEQMQNNSCLSSERQESGFLFSLRIIVYTCVISPQSLENEYEL